MMAGFARNSTKLTCKAFQTGEALLSIFKLQLQFEFLWQSLETLILLSQFVIFRQLLLSHQASATYRHAQMLHHGSVGSGECEPANTIRGLSFTSTATNLY